MKRSRLLLAAVLASGVSALALSVASAAEDTVKTNPGFKAGGQINPGVTLQAPSASASGTDKTTAGGEPFPTPAEARGALLSVEFKNPAIGQVALESPPSANGGNAPTVSTSKDPTTATQGTAAVGGPMAPIAGLENDKSATTGSGQDEKERAIFDAAHKTSPGKPIGSTGHTVPAKYSKRNAILDRVPIMATPMRLLSDEDRARIFQAVMDDKASAAPGADALKPAGQLSTDQALNYMQPLPKSLAGIDGMDKLNFIKSKDKVLLVEPNNRIVVEQIDGAQKS